MNNFLILKLILINASLLSAESFKEAVKKLANELHTITKVAKAVIVSTKGRKKILSVSGGLEAGSDNEFASAMIEMSKNFAVHSEPVVIIPEKLTDKMKYTKKIFQNISGINVLWMPLTIKHGETNYAIWIERMPENKWKEDEIKAFAFIAPFFGNAFENKRKTLRSFGKKYIAICAILIFILLNLIPVHSRINTPVLIKPESPHYIFAPFNGVLSTLHVAPGQKVKSDDIIFSYDSKLLRKQRNEAQRAVASAKAELIRLEGAAYTDNDALSRIPGQKIEVEQKEAEVNFFQEQLDLCEVRTKVDGVVILDDPDALIGAFLQTGQMVMRIANPDRTEIELMIPLADAGLVSIGSKVDVRLDSKPFTVKKAVIKRIGYDPILSRENQNMPSVPSFAAWLDNTDSILPGQRGTAVIKGPNTILGLQLFRKPLIALRSFFGI